MLGVTVDGQVTDNVDEMIETVWTNEMDVEVIQSTGSDEMICSAARVSTGRERKAGGEEGLLKYLMTSRHGSPFEHGSVTFRVRAPIFVWREWHRHRIGVSYNEESGRYKILEPRFYLPIRGRYKVDNWKPGRPKFQEGEVNVSDWKRVMFDSYQVYLRYLSLNLDPGLARICMPVGVFSSCYVTFNPRSLMNFLSLRVGSDKSTFRSYPLYEIEVCARKCEELAREIWPITLKLFDEHGRVAP